MVYFCKKAFLLSLLSIFLFNSQLLSQPDPTNTGLGDGSFQAYKMNSVAEEIANIETASRSYIDQDGILRTIDKGEFPLFDQKLSEYLGRLSIFLEDYKKTYDQIPDVVTKELLAELDIELKKQGYKTVTEINQKSYELHNEYMEEIIPARDVTGRRHYDKHRTEPGFIVVAQAEKIEGIEGIKNKINNSLKILEPLAKEHRAQYESIVGAIKAFSKDAKVYVDAGKITEEVIDGQKKYKFTGEKTPEGNLSIKKLFLMDQIARLSILEQKRIELDVMTKELEAKKGSFEILNKIFSAETPVEEKQVILAKIREFELKDPQHKKHFLSDIVESYILKGKLNKTQTEDLSSIIHEMDKIVNTYYGPREIIKPSKITRAISMGRSFTGNFFTFYVAMLSTRLTGVLTGGSFTTNIHEKQELLKTGENVKSGNIGPALESFFGDMINPYFHLSFISFSATSAGINLGLQQTKIVQNTYRRSYQQLYPITANKGKHVLPRLTTGVFIPAAAMSIGMYAAQVVPQFAMFYDELYSEHKAIRDVARDMFVENNFTPKAGYRILAVMASFTAAELILNDKLIYVGQIAWKIIKTRNCKDIYNKMKSLREKQIGIPKSPNIKKQMLKMVLVFNMAHIIENMVFYNLFPEIYDTKKADEYGQKLALMELENFIDALLVLAPDPSYYDLEYVYEKSDNVILGDIVSVFRKSPQTIKKALSFINEENGQDVVTGILSHFINYIYENDYRGTLDGMITTNMFFAKLEQDVEKQKELQEEYMAYINSSQHKKEIEANAQNTLITIRTTSKSEAIRDLAEEIDTDLLANSMLFAENVMLLESSLTMNLETGDIDKAIGDLKELATNYYHSPEPLLQHMTGILNSYKSIGPDNNYTMTDIVQYSTIQIDTGQITAATPTGEIIIISNSELFNEVKNTDTRNNFNSLGYLFIVLTPEMMTPRFTDAKGNSANEFNWRREIITSLAKNLHTKIKNTASEEDYFTGMLVIYKMYYNLLESLPATAEEYSIEVQTAYTIEKTIEAFGLPWDVDLFIKKYNTKNKKIK